MHTQTRCLHCEVLQYLSRLILKGNPCPRSSQDKPASKLTLKPDVLSKMAPIFFKIIVKSVFFLDT